jgi:hypothetical protein
MNYRKRTELIAIDVVRTALRNLSGRHSRLLQ